MTVSAALRSLLAVVVSSALLAGCGLPTGSDVRAGRRVGENVAPRARVVVNPPAPGASQEVIARDFIRAGAAFQEVDEHQQVVGRAYLAGGSVDRWRPTTSPTTVYDTRTPMTVEQLPADQIRLTVVAVASIDGTGHYRELPPGTLTSVVFTMTKVDGQWRIQLPDEGFGLWLTTEDFSRVFAAYGIHYVLPTERRLVADVRWFPAGPRAATALARAQLGPVPAYLTGVAASAVPPGTRLAVDAVKVDGTGVATVTLTNSAQTIDPGRRRSIWAQFVATLTQAPGVSSVSIEVQGIGPIPVSNLPSAVGSLTDLGYTSDLPAGLPAALKRTGELVERVSPQDLGEGGATRPPPRPAKPGPDLPRIPAAYVDLALSADGADLAGVARSRAELVRWRGATPITLPPFGTALTKPMYAADGRLWIAGLDAQRQAQVWTFEAAAAQAAPPLAVRADWLTGRQVVSLSVSPDATRLAVLSRLPDGTDSRMDVAGIVRDGSGQATSLAAPYRQGEPLTGFVDVIWLDSMSLAVLAQATAADPTRPFQVDLGQGVGLRRIGQLDLEQTLVKEMPGATRITSRGGVRGLVVMTGKGAFVRVGNAWDQVPGVSEVVIGGT